MKPNTICNSHLNIKYIDVYLAILFVIMLIQLLSLVTILEAYLEIVLTSKMELYVKTVNS